MSAAEVLAELGRLGLRHEVVGATLRVHGAVPPALAELIRAYKPEIVAALSVPGSDGAEAVATRVSAFRQQLREWREAGRTGEPFYVLFDAIEFKDGTCVSCGGPRRQSMGPTDMALRCSPCAEAASIAVEEESR